MAKVHKVVPTAGVGNPETVRQGLVVEPGNLLQTSYSKDDF